MHTDTSFEQCSLLSFRTSDKSSDVGDEMCENPIIRKISFTGSTGVGKHLMKLSSDTMKKLSLGKCLRQ